jgi:hypothetical protein
LQTRSHESILAEANQLVWDKDFKGYIHDVGGPTANFRHTACDKQVTKGACINKQCLFPTPCKSLRIDHSDYLSLLRKLRTLPNVKKVFIRSGIRFDYLIEDKDDTFMEELCEHHVSGQLKVAPEHICDSVLKLMGKPENAVYEKFLEKFKKINKKLGKEQYVVPYLISSHPGSTLKEAVELAEYLRDLGYMPEQVQDFYPTPSTISTCMYYTGLDPRTLEEVYVPKSPHEKAMQRALIQYRNPKNYDLVVEALKLAGRMDLIGFDKKCLIRPRQLSKEKSWVEKDKQGAGKTGYSKGKQEQPAKKSGYTEGKQEQSAKKSGYTKGRQEQSAKKSGYTKGKQEATAYKSGYTKGKQEATAYKSGYTKRKQEAAAYKPDYLKERQGTASKKTDVAKDKQMAPPRKVDYSRDPDKKSKAGLQRDNSMNKSSKSKRYYEK